MAGYYISEDRRSIYGPNGYTGYYINGGRPIYGPRGYTGFYVNDDRAIYGPSGYTGCWIGEGRIYGPDGNLPWAQ